MSSLYDLIKVKRVGLDRSPWFRELYYRVLKMSWLRFLNLVAIFYLCMNLFFALLYYAGGDVIANANHQSLFDYFVFSIQTSGTIGYGFLLPKTPYAHIIVVIESISSMMFVAIITGLTFAKFARPQIRVIFSKVAVITMMDGVPTLMFRMGNARDSHIVDAVVNVTVLLPFKSKEGLTMSRFIDLKLERERSPFFALTWTVMHKINEQSPLYGAIGEKLKSSTLGVIVSMTGLDDVFAQMVHVNHRYAPEDILVGKKFRDVVELLPNGIRQINFQHFDEVLGDS